jgi:hypothetical protein
MTIEQPATEAERLQRVQEQLDEALGDSFPASDPVSIVTSQTEEDWTRKAAAPTVPPAKP